MTREASSDNPAATPPPLLGPGGIDPGAAADLLGGRWIRDPLRGDPIFGASIDTRSARPGEVFFALRGEHADGHSFLGRAADAGCAFAVVDRPELVCDETGEMGVLAVADARVALGVLAGAYRRSLPGLRVVGVTGSNGKTTTVRLLHAALSTELRGTCSPGSFNNDLGVPLTLLAARPGDGYAVCEMGTSGPGEIARLAAIAKPDAAVVTSIGRSHLEFLGSVRGVAEEKADLVRALPPDGLAVVCRGAAELDEALGRGVCCHVVCVGTDDVTAIEPTRDGVRAEFRGRAFSVPIAGAHNAINAAMAIETAAWMGVGFERAAAGIGSFTPPPMRLQRAEIAVAGGSITVINDAYNANPESMLAGLGAFFRGELDPPGDAGRRIAVVGEMLELGEHAVGAHEEVARVLIGAGGSLDGVLLIGAHAARMAEQINGACAGLVRLAEADAGSDWPARAAGLFAAGDVVLLKGSRGVRLERLAETLGSRPADAEIG